jgi:hypothetical protein
MKARRSEEGAKMKAVGIRAVAAIFLLASAALLSSATAQAQGLRDQLAGTWALLSFESFDPSGKKVPSMEGGDLEGRLILTRGGLLSVQIISEFPKLTSKDRLNTTPTEDRALAHGVLSFFGTYTVSEAERLINFRVERSSYPNQVTGKDSPRRVTLTGNQLRFDNPVRTAGGNVVIVWKRIE